MSLKKIEFRNFLKESILVSITEYITLGSLFVNNIILNNFYGVSELGDFSYIYTISQVLLIGLGGALSIILRKSILDNIKEANNYFSTTISLRVYVIIVVGIIITVLILLGSFKSINLIFILLLFVSKSLDILNDTYFILYQTTNRLNTYAKIKLTFALISMVFCFLSALFFPVISIYFSLLGASLITFLFNKFTHNSSIKINFEIDSHKKTMFIDAWPLTVNSIMFQTSSRINVFLIFSFLGNLSLGIFTSALTVITVFTAASNSLGIILFPKLNTYFNLNKNLFIKQLRKISFFVFLVGTLVWVIFYLTIPLQFLMLKNLPEFKRIFFLILSISIPFIYVTSVLGNVLVIIKEQKLAMFSSIFVLFLSVFVYFFLIKMDGKIGPAMAYSFMTVLQVLVIILLLNVKLKS